MMFYCIILYKKILCKLHSVLFDKSFNIVEAPQLDSQYCRPHVKSHPLARISHLMALYLSRLTVSCGIWKAD